MLHSVHTCSEMSHIFFCASDSIVNPAYRENLWVFGCSCSHITYKVTELQSFVVLLLNQANTGLFSEKRWERHSGSPPLLQIFSVSGGWRSRVTHLRVSVGPLSCFLLQWSLLAVLFFVSVFSQYLLSVILSLSLFWVKHHNRYHLVTQTRCLFRLTYDVTSISIIVCLNIRLCLYTSKIML